MKINQKMTRNKFFSPALMWEGIKQTKTLGICFTILSLIASLFVPIGRAITMYSLDSYTFRTQPVSTLSLNEFLLPKFIMMYLIPLILTFSLFKFMNSRNASDFYHSVPLSRACVYITYSAVVIIWCIFIISLCTFSSLICYTFVPRLAAIPAEFAGYTILASFILSLLVMSISLVAKGLSGTRFSNVVIALLIMFAPRIILLLFGQSVIYSTDIVNVSDLVFIDPTYNIIFAPFSAFNSFTKPSTILYSVILAVIYFVIGLVLHIKRKSETAGTSSSFKCVQHIVRTAIGIIPVISISFSLASKEDVSTMAWIICIVFSLLFYFIYELATTRSAKKLVIAIPLYLVVVLFNVLFVSLSLGVSHIVLNDIPQIEDIESVSICDSHNSFNMTNYDLKSYYSLLADETRIDDADVIKILQESLEDNVNAIKTSRYFYTPEKYSVTFHLKSGRDLKRNVSINQQAYLSNSEINDDLQVILPYLEKNKEYMDTVTALPDENEISSISLTSYSYEITNEQCKELWKTFRAEYSELSYAEREYIMLGESDSFGCVFDISGYHNNNAFTSYYTISPSDMPKTFNMLASILNEATQKNFTNEVINNISADEDFIINAGVSLPSMDYNDFYMYIQSCEESYNASNLYICAYFPNLKTNYDDIFSAEDIPKIKKIVQIIHDASLKGFDVSKPNSLELYIEFFSERDATVSDGNGSVRYIDQKPLFVNLSDEQYKEISDIIGSFVNNTYDEMSEE